MQDFEVINKQIKVLIKKHNRYDFSLVQFVANEHISHIILCPCTFTVGFPLTVLGGILGKNSTLPRFDAPCRTKNIPREIPHLTWYHTLPVQMMVGGFLPFRYTPIIIIQ